MNFKRYTTLPKIGHLHMLITYDRHYSPQVFQCSLLSSSKQIGYFRQIEATLQNVNNFDMQLQRNFSTQRSATCVGLVSRNDGI